VVTNAIIFGILLGVTAVGYFIRAGLVVIIAGLGIVIFGFTLWPLYAWLSIILVLVGMILVWQGAKS
jgi:hypothetical protein